MRNVRKVDADDHLVAMVVTGTPDHPTVKLETFDGDASSRASVRLRKVGAFWVAILSPPPAAARSYPDSRSVYILTDVWE